MGHIHPIERINTATALLGALASVYGVIWLIGHAISSGDPWKIVSFSIYGITLLLTYVFATMFHATHGHAKAFFAKLDHLSIYLLIAGTYTPFTLVTLRDGIGWPLFIIIWLMALLGIALDWMPKHGRRLLPVIVYLIMGWLMVAAIRPLFRALPEDGIYYLFWGSLIYSAGVIFYLQDHRFSFFHGIWHLFVIGGSFCHYLSIYYFIA